MTYSLLYNTITTITINKRNTVSEILPPLPALRKYIYISKGTQYMAHSLLSPHYNMYIYILEEHSK